MNINTMTFADRDFWRRRGVSDEHTRQRSVRSEQRSLRPKRPAALRVAPNLACGFVARRLQPLWRMRPPRASPQAKLGATNAIVFMFMTTKYHRAVYPDEACGLGG